MKRKVLRVVHHWAQFNVPVLEKMYEHYGDDFLAVCEKNPSNHLAYEAVRAGKFPRIMLETYTRVLSSGHDDGVQTPTHLHLTPALLPVLIRHMPKVIITSNFGLWTMTAIFMRLFRTKIVLWWTGSEHSERTVSRPRRMVRKAICFFCDSYVTNGKLSTDYLVSLGVDRNKIIEGGTSPDTNSVLEACTGEALEKAKKMKKDIGATGTTFLFVGRLVKGKGADHLLKAFHLLGQKLSLNGKASLILVGEGAEEEELKEFVRSKGMDNVYFAGGFSPKDVPPYYALSDVLVMPTLQDTWGVVVSEAMTAGMPVLTTIYNGSWPDLMRDGENGFLFDPLNHEELAQKMGFFLEHPEKISEFGQKSRELVARYTPEKIAQVHIRAVDMALSG